LRTDPGDSGLGGELGEISRADRSSEASLGGLSRENTLRGSTWPGEIWSEQEESPLDRDPRILAGRFQAKSGRPDGSAGTHR